MSDLTVQWDRQDRASLEAQGSFKWSLFPGTIGAWIAEMDFGISPAITQALHDAVDAGGFGYLPHEVEARSAQACSDWLAESFEWIVPSSAVKALPDVLRALEILIDHFMEEDAPVVVPTPAYSPFLAIPRLRGRQVIEVPLVLDEEQVWRFDEEAIEKALTPAGGLLILCNPHNPVGRVFTKDELTNISHIVERTNARVFADEIHAPLVYEPHRHVPYASISELAACHAVTAISASKAWNMPGLKCAQLILTNPSDMERYSGLTYFDFRGASNLGLVAAEAAFRAGQPWLSEVLQYLNGTKSLLESLVEQHLPGARFVSPEATYLAWIDMTAVVGDVELAEFLRANAGVSVTGGEECGAVGLGCFRFNFATSRSIVSEAIPAIADAIRAH